jgi:hypothetical protein
VNKNISLKFVCLLKQKSENSLKSAIKVIRSERKGTIKLDIQSRDFLVFKYRDFDDWKRNKELYFNAGQIFYLEDFFDSIIYEMENKNNWKRNGDSYKLIREPKLIKLRHSVNSRKIVAEVREIETEDDEGYCVYEKGVCIWFDKDDYAELTFEEILSLFYTTKKVDLLSLGMQAVTLALATKKVDPVCPDEDNINANKTNISSISNKILRAEILNMSEDELNKFCDKNDIELDFEAAGSLDGAKQALIEFLEETEED